MQLEQIYILVKHLGFTYRDAINLNVSYRKWFIERYIKELEVTNKKQETAQDVNSDNFANLNQYESMLNKKFS